MLRRLKQKIVYTKKYEGGFGFILNTAYRKCSLRVRRRGFSVIGI